MSIWLSCHAVLAMVHRACMLKASLGSCVSVWQVELEYTTMHSVTAAMEIWYDPDPESTVIEEDLEVVEQYFEVPDEGVDASKMSPWLLRVELNKNMMVDKKLTMGGVAEKILSEFGSDISCIYSGEPASAQACVCLRSARGNAC